MKDRKPLFQLNKLLRRNKQKIILSQGRVIAVDSDRRGRNAAGDAVIFSANQDESFEVSVQNADPLMKRADEEKAGRAWLNDLQINLAATAVIVAMFGLLLTSSDLPEMIFFAAPAIPVFIIMSTLESLDMEKVRLYTGLVITVALIALFVIFRKYIGSGWALITGYLYDNAEFAQAYIYDRFNVSEIGNEHPYRSMHIALLWSSAIVSLLASLPSTEIRRWVTGFLGCAVMMTYAYYGLIPSTMYITILICAMVFAFARGHILSSVPVLLLVMIIFGAVVMINPGENYGISRVDENFRDRFALRSIYLDRGDQALDDLSQLEQNMQDNQTTETGENSEFLTQNRGLMAAVIVIGVIAVLALLCWLMLSRVRKRQRANRAGIDSAEPGVAVRAMFPYAVRWLQPAGIETSGKTFDSLLPMIRSEISEEYAGSYEAMYNLWQEAAYSDHEIVEEQRQEMSNFLSDTISMIKNKGSFGSTFINRIRYAL